MRIFIFPIFLATIVYFVSNLAHADSNQSIQQVNRTKLSTIMFPLDSSKIQESSGIRPPPIIKPCLENELLYPLENAGEWICDCKPGFLYYPLTNMCYESHTQGPCENNKIIILTKKSTIPECVDNPCALNEVIFNGDCFRLDSEDGCSKYKLFTGRKILLQVDATDFELKCADEQFKYICRGDCCKPRKIDRDMQEICLKF